MPLRSLAPLLKLCAATAAVLLLIDATLFRSGMYFDVIKPDSTVGSVVNTALAVETYYEPSRKNILVLGNSRIGEGFSAELADEAAASNGLHFINGSVPGTTPRSWYYLLRSIDPDARRFAAIAMMVDYDIAANRLNMPNYALDTNYLAPLLRLADLDDYPASFTRDDERQRARRAILLPAQSLHEDLRDLITHPIDRFGDLHRYRKDWLYSFSHYPGREGRLPQLEIDTKTGLPEDWSLIDADLKARLQPYFSELHDPPSAQMQAANANYLREWLGRITSRYSGRKIPIIVFVVPRGPWHRLLAPVPVATGPIAELAAAGDVLVLPGNAFVNLEQPQYFYDTLHMNRDGRAAFSRLFAQQIAPLVH